MKATDAPLCGVCGSRHWLREEHVFDAKAVKQELEPVKQKKVEPFKHMVEPSKHGEVTAELEGGVKITGSVEEMRRVMSALGRRGGASGGKARAAKLSPERRTEIARAAARARWGKR